MHKINLHLQNIMLKFVVTTVLQQKTSYHRSSGLITTLLSTLKVVHNVTDKTPIHIIRQIIQIQFILVKLHIQEQAQLFCLESFFYYFWSISLSLFVRNCTKRKMCSRNCQHKQIEYLNTKQIFNTYGNKAQLFGYYFN